jgi:hypothetical protein
MAMYHYTLSEGCYYIVEGFRRITLSAVCWSCLDDEHLKAIIREKGEVQLCSECKARRKALTAEDLAELLDPILREHYAPGKEVQQFGDDDDHWWEQEGEQLSHIVQEALGEDLSFYNEIVDALIENDGARPQDGEERFFSNEINYVERRLIPYRLDEMWDFVTELASPRRSSARCGRIASFTWLPPPAETAKSGNRSPTQPPHSSLKSRPAQVSLVSAQNKEAQLLLSLSVSAAIAV